MSRSVDILYGPSSLPDYNASLARHKWPLVLPNDVNCVVRVSCSSHNHACWAFSTNSIFVKIFYTSCRSYALRCRSLDLLHLDGALFDEFGCCLSVNGHYLRDKGYYSPRYTTVIFTIRIGSRAFFCHIS